MDELADHLACAYRRELLRGADPATARQRVLERFGDPAAVARRLWLDAMRGRIMSQRILVVCCVVADGRQPGHGVHHVEPGGHARRMVEMKRPWRKRRRHEAEIARKKMLEQLAAISKASEPARVFGVDSRDLQADPERHADGPPAAGFHVSLGRGSPMKVKCRRP